MWISPWCNVLWGFPLKLTTNLAGVFGQIPRCTTGLCRKRYDLCVILLVFSQTSCQFILVYKLDYMHIKVFRKHVVGIVI